jgi:hypothetical protein
MIVILNHLYSSAQSQNRLTLEQIQLSNKDLYKRLRLEADNNVRQMLSNRSTTTTHPTGFSQQRGQLPGPRTPFIGTKRLVTDNLPPPDNTHFQGPSPGAFPGRGDPFPSRDLNQGDHHQQVPSGRIVNGFVYEQPVEIDIDRAHALTESLLLATTGKYAVCDGTTTLAMHLGSLVHRVQDYLRDVKRPPELPVCLTGQFCFCY